MHNSPVEGLAKLRSKSSDGRCRRLLRLKAAAYYLGKSPWTLRAMVHRGEIPVIFCGENVPWLFDVNDLDAWIERHKKAC